MTKTGAKPVDTASVPRDLGEAEVELREKTRQLEAAHVALEERLRFETLISSLSSTFINLPSSEVDREIERALGQIVEFLGIDRSTVFQFSPCGKQLWVTHSFAVPGIQPMKKIVMSEEYPFYSVLMQKGKVIRYSRLPDELEDVAIKERAYCEATGYKSNLTMPLAVGGDVIGAVGFGSFRTYRAWPDELVARLLVVCGIFASALARKRGDEDRKRAEDALRESEEKYRIVAQAARDGIVSINKGGEIIYANAAAEGIFGYPAGDVVGRPVTDLMPEALRARCFEGLERFIRTGQKTIPWEGLEFNGRHRDGHEIPIELSLGEMRSEDGEYMFTGIVRDLTQKRLAEEEARQLRERLAQAAKLASLGEMAGGIAHELNQPLAAIATYSQACARMIEAGKLQHDEGLGAVRKIGEEAIRAGEIIHSIREMIGSRQLHKSECDVNQLIADAMKLAHFDPRLSDVQLNLRLGEQLPNVIADGVQIQQVVLNLVVNGAESMRGIRGSEKQLEIRTSANGDRTVQVTVADHGAGISADAEKKLFEPFYSTKDGGMGMGLSICRTIVNHHGGRLWFDRLPRRGTSFHFTLPVSSS